MLGYMGADKNGQAGSFVKIHIEMERNMTETGLWIFLICLLVVVIIATVVAVVSAVSGATAAIVDDEESEEE